MARRSLFQTKVAWLLATVGTLSLLLGTSAVTTAADEKDKQIQELRDRLERLEKEVGMKKEAPPATAAPAPAPMPGAPGMPMPGAPAAPAEAPQSVGDRIKSLEEAIKSTPLFSVVKDWQFGGHVAVSYNYNFNNPKSQSNFSRVFDDKANQFDINQAELYIEKPTTEASRIGFGLDFVIGRDAKKIHSLGLGISSGDDMTKSDVFDLTQAYVTYKAPIGNGLDLKAGKFVTLSGAEMIRRTADYQISRSFLFGFAMPFTHTGLLATYPFADWFSLSLGIVNGWDNTDDNNNDKTIHGAATITPIKELTVTLSGTWGAEQKDRNGPKRGLLDLVATYKPTPPLTLTVNYDYGEEDDAVSEPATGKLKTARWQGIAAYAQYDFSDRFSVGFRGEYFIDEQGFRFGFTDPLTGNPGRLALWEMTLTTRYKLFDHLFASVEYRHDEATNNRLVFDDGAGAKNADSQDTIAFELVYQF